MLSLCNDNYEKRFCKGSYQGINHFLTPVIWLNISLQIVHQRIVRFGCPLCEYETSNTRKLNDHIRSVHLDMRPLQCKHCDMRFSKAQHLQSHVITVHKNEKKLGCPYCEVTFKERKRLLYHIKVLNLHLTYVLLLMQI